MFKNLTDKYGNQINTGDIVKNVNIEENIVRYYIYTKGMLFRYDELGDIDEKGFFNIKVDGGLSLVNDKTRYWIRQGKVEEAYSKIFIR